jgi:hypothetical protein
VTTAHSLFKIIGNIDVSTESELLEVKVPIIFLVTRDSRHPGTNNIPSNKN